MYIVRQFNSRNGRSVLVACWVGQTHEPKHVWTSSNLCLHELQTQTAEEAVRVRGVVWQILEQVSVRPGETLPYWQWLVVNTLWSTWVFWVTELVQGRARRCAGWPRMTQNVDRVRTLVCSDRRLGVGLTAEDYRNLFGGTDSNSGLTSGYSPMTMPLCMMCLELASSWLRNSLQKRTAYLIHLTKPLAIFGYL
jgi:hypothetical protein